ERGHRGGGGAGAGTDLEDGAGAGAAEPLVDVDTLIGEDAAEARPVLLPELLLVVGEGAAAEAHGAEARVVAAVVAEIGLQRAAGGQVAEGAFRAVVGIVGGIGKIRVRHPPYSPPVVVKLQFSGRSAGGPSTRAPPPVAPAGAPGDHGRVSASAAPGGGPVDTPDMFIRAADWAHARDFGCPAGLALRRVLLELTGP